MRWLAVIGAIIFLLFLGVSAFVITVTSRSSDNDNRSSVDVVEKVRQRFVDHMVMVVPHHDVVKDRRVRLFKERSRTVQPDTIILLSPNHFDAGYDDIITTSRVWSVSNGEGDIQPARELIDTIVDAQLVTLDDTVFRSEHGVKNLLGEIDTFFPNATLLPLVLKEQVDPNRLALLVEALVALCDECGVIASVDMSHYQPATVADIHDIQTLRALLQLDIEEAWDAEVDSAASLAFAMQWARAVGLKQFMVVDHTNSGTLSSSVEAETTSHIFGYYTSTAQRSAQSVTEESLQNSLTFTFGGDAMFGRFVGNQFQDGGFRDLFSRLGNRTFWGTDISWVNLEGPVSNEVVLQSTDPDNTRFLFSRQAVSALQYLRVTTVGLGNNHTFDAGKQGFETTKAVLAAASIDAHGSSSAVSQESVLRYEQGDVRVSLVSVNALATTDSGDVGGLSELIATEDAAGWFVVVLPHWGVEYQMRHSLRQEEMARQWIAAGADFIVGSHPHVVQDAQVIDGVLVLYSLGNFVFDQTFSSKTQEGLLVTGVVDRESLRVVLVPIESKALRPAMLRGERRQTVIDHVCANIQVYCTAGVITVPL